MGIPDPENRCQRSVLLRLRALCFAHHDSEHVQLTPNLTSFGGTVTDSCSGNPVAGAIVSWNGSSTATGNDGTYVINNAPCGTASLTVTKTGYQTASQSYTPTCQTSNLKNISLTPVVPADSNDQISEADYQGVPSPTTPLVMDYGNIDNPFDGDMFSIGGAAGQRLSFDTVHRNGSTLASYLRLFTASGSVLEYSDDDPAPGEFGSNES